MTGPRPALFLSLLLLLVACTPKTPAPPPVAVARPDRPIDYLAEVRPVLERRCVVCHSCYNSPCQLKLDSHEGLARGASKMAVYNATRRQTMSPTRLFLDADTALAWRDKGFHAVADNGAPEGGNDSTLVQLIDHKRRTPFTGCQSFRPEEDELTCAASGEELGDYLQKHPNRGMPYGFPPLSDQEYLTISGWLAQGGLDVQGEAKRRLLAPAVEDEADIRGWEAFLNAGDAKHAMTARYLYEHLFLAHINFAPRRTTFYELLRYRLVEGREELVATTLPYDPPGAEIVRYRFRKIHSTIAHKTHMVFTLSPTQLERITDLFITPVWRETPRLVGYDREVAANPFKAFAQIPVASRYQFLLDNIHYIIMTFIRGPVCKGQVALNVVRDHFWLLFLDPGHDISLLESGFLADNEKLLEMPITRGDGFWERLFSVLGMEFRRKSSAYVRERQAAYARRYQDQGPGTEAIWKGEEAPGGGWRRGEGRDTPLLTVLRHFDSASVEVGPLGNLPETVWVMDYPLIERIYYALVAGFDVFGNRMHQMSIRLYMDELRQEAETYFIDFLPKAERRRVMQSWYGQKDLDSVRVDYHPSPLESGFVFSGGDGKRELVEYLVDRHFPSAYDLHFDANYLRAGETYPQPPASYSGRADYFRGLLSLTRPGTSFFSTVKDHNANLAFVRVIVDGGEKDRYFTIVVNRWHDDVATMFFEERRLRAERDNAVFLEGLVGSYPNYFVEVDLPDLPDFIDLLQTYDGSQGDRARLARYGVNRMRPDFWQVYDWFQCEFNRRDPVQAGLLDLNRYYHQALVTGSEEAPRAVRLHPACAGPAAGW